MRLRDTIWNTGEKDWCFHCQMTQWHMVEAVCVLQGETKLGNLRRISRILSSDRLFLKIYLKYLGSGSLSLS